MASALWGKVYYDTTFAGELRQEPGGRCVFTYDPAYLEAATSGDRFHPSATVGAACLRAGAASLLRQSGRRRLAAQRPGARAQDRSQQSLRSAAGFRTRLRRRGFSVIDPAPLREPVIDIGDPAAIAALAQPWLALRRAAEAARGQGRANLPSGAGDEPRPILRSFPSGTLRDIVENEFLSFCLPALCCCRTTRSSRP